MNQRKSFRLLLYLCLIGGAILHVQSAGASVSELRAALTRALENQCIPKDEEGCGIYKPRFEDNACYCGNPIYMRYDTAQRTCQVICPAGQMPDIVSSIQTLGASASGCPAGYGPMIIKDF